MLLLIFDLIEGCMEQEVKILLDVVYCVVLCVFEVLECDCYQIVYENKVYYMVIEDIGFGLICMWDLVVVWVYISLCSEVQKQCFFVILQEELVEYCGLSGDDLMVLIISNQKGDWSFGCGVVQYFIGDL